MLTITVELLHGTFRGDASGAANTGRLEYAEWPPAPSRLFAALVAADGTRDRCRVTNGAELEWFERLPAPIIHACMLVHHQPLQSRYVVEQGEHAAKSPKSRELFTHQEYIGRKGVSIRPGARATPRQPQVVYRWDNDTPSESVLAALRRRAARIGYLGTADSPARIRVLTQMPEEVIPGEPLVPDPDGDVPISVPAPGDLQILNRAYDAWCEHGANTGRIQFPALRHDALYRKGHSTARDPNGSVIQWLRLGAPVSGRRVSAVTALFKAAVLSRYQALYGEAPATLHGHGFHSKGYEIARFLALPNVGSRWSRGQIHGVALWIPGGIDSATARRCRDAAANVRRLTGKTIDVSVARCDEQERPVVMRPERWTRPSRRWTTAVPAIHERRRPLDLAELERWCAHAGLPAPTGFRAGRAPFVRGGLDLAPIEVNRPGKIGLPYSHVELLLPHPVSGPVVIGSGRQRGFGLCVPIFDG